jgi:excisionase family DNA binding protein
MVSLDTNRELSILEGAWRWSLHPSTLRRAVQRGELPHSRVLGKIRIRAEDLEQFVRGRGRSVGAEERRE